MVRDALAPERERYRLTKPIRFDIMKSDQTYYIWYEKLSNCDFVSQNLLDLIWKVIKPRYSLTKPTRFDMKNDQTSILSH